MNLLNLNTNPTFTLLLYVTSFFFIYEKQSGHVLFSDSVYNAGWPPLNCLDCRLWQHLNMGFPSRRKFRSITFAWGFLGPEYWLKFKSIRAIANFNRCWCISGNRLGLFLGGVWMLKSTEIGASHGILARPFTCQFIIFLPVSFVYPGYLWYQWVVWIWITQQGAYWQ